MHPNFFLRQWATHNGKSQQYLRRLLMHRSYASYAGYAPRQVSGELVTGEFMR